MNTVDHISGYSVKNASPTMEFQPKLRILSEFLEHLETKCDVDINNTSCACHKLSAKVMKDEAGDVVGREYSVKCETDGVYQPYATPRKSSAGWDGAGSVHWGWSRQMGFQHW